jgi:hypothetical protein
MRRRQKPIPPHVQPPVASLRVLLRPRHDLILEPLALRQQIPALQRTNPKPPFRDRDRAFWIVLCRWWAGWRRPLHLVRPGTVAIDFLAVPTVTFRTLYVFVVLSLDRRVTHLNVTTHPNVNRGNGHEGEQVCCRGA